MIRIIFFILLFFVANSLLAQTSSDSIFISKSFWGYKFYQQNQRLNFNQLPYVMEPNLEAFQLIKSARNMHTVSSIISGVGGFLIGLQLGSVIIGGEPNWTVAAIGGGLIVVSIPIFSKSYRKSIDAIEIYNQVLISKEMRKPEFYFGFSNHGIGLRCLF